MTIAHRIEAAAARAAIRLLRRLGPQAASDVGGATARFIGPWLPVSRVAERNLRLAMPELDHAARRAIIRGVWDNLGRTAGEFPHVPNLRETERGPGYELVGREHLAQVRARGGAALMFTGHIGNWEVLPLAAAQLGLGLASLYRPAENKLIDELILGLRRGPPAGANVNLFPKGAAGARQTLQHLRGGGFVGLLVDQKMNDGIEARFFDLPAMTASALASMALKFRCPVIPSYTERIGPARIRVTCEAPLPIPDTGDRTQDIRALTQSVNDRLESWIRARPESWLWLHRRWPKSYYSDQG